MPQLDLVKFSLLFIFIWLILNISFFFFFTFYFLQKIIVFKLTSYRLRYYYYFFFCSFELSDIVFNLRLLNCESGWVKLVG